MEGCMKRQRLRRINLKDDERKTLQSLVQKHTAKQSVVVRARIILLADEGMQHQEIAQELSIRNNTYRFSYTPKHASWMNQIEIWFGILMRKVITRGFFLSRDNLKNKILNFMDYFNETMAKPFKWTYKGKVLSK
jgi:transposase